MNNNFNFAHSLSRKKRHSIKYWLGFSLLIFILFLVYMFGLQTRLKKQNAIVQNEKAKLEKIISQEKTTENDNELLVSVKNKKIIRIKKGNDNPSLLLNEISERMPKNVRITSFSRNAGKQIILNGQTKKMDGVKQFVQSLKESSILTSIKLQTVEPNRDATNFVAFTIEGYIKK